MERITLKPRWVYDIEFSGMEDCRRILITDLDDETITGLAADGEFVTLAKDAIEDIRLAKLDRAEAQIWRASLFWWRIIRLHSAGWMRKPATWAASNPPSPHCWRA